MFSVFESIEKNKTFEGMICDEGEQGGTMVILSDLVQDKISSFLNEDGVIDYNNPEAKEYLDNLHLELDKYF